jgi:hypothetical protein
MVPDIDGCQPKTTDFLDWKSLSERQKNVKQKMVPDKRLQLEEECVKKIPFDLIQTNDIHGYLEASVLATIRTYISEFILKTLPVLTSLEFNGDNYDDGVAQMIVQQMESDMPERGGWLDWTWIKRYDYWLHFLEQCYQAVHRRVKMKEIEATPEMQQVFDDITQAQRNYGYINNNTWERMQNRVHPESIPYLKKKYPGLEIKDVYARGKHPLRGRRVLVIDGSVEDRIEDADWQVMKGATIIYFGAQVDQITEYAVQGKDEYHNFIEFDFDSLGFTKRHARRCAKLWTLYSMRNEAKKMLKYLVKEELEKYSQKIADTLKPAPKIANLAKYYIGASQSIINGGLQSGKVSVERALPATLESTGEEIMQFIEDPGTCLDVSKNVLTHNPLDEVVEDLSKGQFMLEKYIRLTDKPEDESANVPGFIKNRPDHLKGVVNIGEFRDFVNNNMIDNPTFDMEQYNLSDLFGDAEILRDLSERATGIVGSIGFKFGIRLSYVPPSGFTPPPASEESKKIAQREKAYYVKTAGSDNTRHIIPLINFEKDVLDDKVSKINWNDEHFGEDFRCYINNLIKDPQFKLIFDNVFPLRRVPTMVAVYMNYSWLPSIGKHPEERDWNSIASIRQPDDSLEDVWQEGLFEGTKVACYRMFHGFYETDSWDFNWDWSVDVNFNLLFKDMMPKLFTNLDPSVRWWQRWRVEQNRPFDKDGSECNNIIGNLFSW